MAQELGLLVHSVNERLRDAQRQMAVSSSRQAARLLRTTGLDSPQSLGVKHLGDAEATTERQTTNGLALRDRNFSRVGPLAMGAEAITRKGVICVFLLVGRGAFLQPVSGSE
jgi:hypothetical protein